MPLLRLVLLLSSLLNLAAADPARMFAVPGLPADPARIDWAQLPVVRSERAVVFRARPGQADYNMHGYLARHGGRLWAVWSSGREFEDTAGQQVRFATSADGLTWSESGLVVAADPDGDWRYIARGLWVRNGELLALAARDDAWTVVNGVREKGKYFGPHLELHAFRLNAAGDGWEPAGVVLDDTINNYHPQQLPSGEWLMSRRDQHKTVTMALGGVRALDDWRILPLAKAADGHEMSEPCWWALPDGRLAMLFRDNDTSFRLYRSFSQDQGRTWSPPVRTDFPDGRAKSNVLRLRDGRYALVNNPQPGAARIPLCLSLSDDGVVFTRMSVLLGEPTAARTPNPSKRAGYQYPHLVEAGEHLFVIYARNQEDIELLRIRVADL
ncbi:MAG: exo-alpha-sialidase [Opitutaceae bacterium]|nr:exo-alpha-sialidase [Opitutaceae bacterium]